MICLEYSTMQLNFRKYIQPLAMGLVLPGYWIEIFFQWQPIFQHYPEVAKLPMDSNSKANKSIPDDHFRSTAQCLASNAGGPQCRLQFAA